MQRSGVADPHGRGGTLTPKKGVTIEILGRISKYAFGENQRGQGMIPPPPRGGARGVYPERREGGAGTQPATGFRGRGLSNRKKKPGGVLSPHCVQNFKLVGVPKLLFMRPPLPGPDPTVGWGVNPPPK